MWLETGPGTRNKNQLLTPYRLGISYVSCSMVCPRKQGNSVSSISWTRYMMSFQYGLTARYAWTQSFIKVRNCGASKRPPMISMNSAVNFMSGSKARLPPGELSNMNPKSIGRKRNSKFAFTVLLHHAVYNLEIQKKVEFLFQILLRILF
jgi:hypothetical protein